MRGARRHVEQGRRPAGEGRHADEQHQPDPEDRGGEAEEAERLDDLVEETAFVDAGDEPERHADRGGDDQRHQAELQRDKERAADELPDGLAPGPTRAEVARQHVRQPGQILAPGGLVEAEELAQRALGGGVARLPEHLRHHVARHAAHEGKHDHGGEERGRRARPPVSASGIGPSACSSGSGARGARTADSGAYWARYVRASP